MTGSAYQAMDVLSTCDSLYRVGVWGRDDAAIFVFFEAGGLLPKQPPKIVMTGSASNAMDVFAACDSLC